MQNRPSWEETFMNIAKEISRRSTCKRRKVGAVMVKDKHILTTGYNGPPSGHPHCETCHRKESGKDWEKCMAVHAEQNLIIQAALHGKCPKGATVYLWGGSPCVICAKILANAGIKEIHYDLEYPDDLALDTLRRSKIKLYPYKVELMNSDGSRYKRE